MTDVNSPDELVTRLPGVGRWTLDVVESLLLTPHTHRIRVKGLSTEGFAYRASQDVMFSTGGGRAEALSAVYDPPIRPPDGHA